MGVGSAEARAPPFHGYAVLGWLLGDLGLRSENWKFEDRGIDFLM